MAPKALPSQEVLRQLLRYEPETGNLFWLPRGPEMFGDKRAYSTWTTCHSGKRAFCILDDTGYLVGHVCRIKVSAHRVIWALVYGVWPPKDIDHIDNDRTNNRINNLRAVDRSTNHKNKGIGARNKSSRVGVFNLKKTGKWTAQIGSGGKFYNLGTFSTFEDAVSARELAEAEHGFHHNIRHR